MGVGFSVCWDEAGRDEVGAELLECLLLVIIARKCKKRNSGLRGIKEAKISIQDRGFRSFTYR